MFRCLSFFGRPFLKAGIFFFKLVFMSAQCLTHLGIQHTLKKITKVNLRLSLLSGTYFVPMSVVAFITLDFSNLLGHLLRAPCG